MQGFFIAKIEHKNHSSQYEVKSSTKIKSSSKSAIFTKKQAFFNIFTYF